MINNYILNKKLGEGAFAKVMQVLEEKTGNQYAMKIINKAKLKQRSLSPNHNKLDKIRLEVAIMKRVRHPNIVHLIEVIDDPSHNKRYLI